MESELKNICDNIRNALKAREVIFAVVLSPEPDEPKIIYLHCFLNSGKSKREYKLEEILFCCRKEMCEILKIIKLDFDSDVPIIGFCINLYMKEDKKPDLIYRVGVRLKRIMEKEFFCTPDNIRSIVEYETSHWDEILELLEDGVEFIY